MTNRFASKNPNALPRFVQISEFLAREIAAGRLAPGERLAPERHLAKELGISVGTLRKSLKRLIELGLIEAIHGSGNYVRQSQVEGSVYAMFRLELKKGGGLPRADVLNLTYMEKPADLPQFGSSTHASRVRRLRYLNDTIIAIEEIWLDGASGRVEPRKLSDSLYHYYGAHLQLWITRAEDYVTIAPVPPWSPPQFPLPSHTHTAYIERLSWTNAPKPVEYSRTWFDPDKAHYVQRMA